MSDINTIIITVVSYISYSRIYSSRVQSIAPTYSSENDSLWCNLNRCFFEKQSQFCIEGTSYTSADSDSLSYLRVYVFDIY